MHGAPFSEHRSFFCDVRSRLFSRRDGSFCFRHIFVPIHLLIIRREDGGNGCGCREHVEGERSFLPFFLLFSFSVFLLHPNTEVFGKLKQLPNISYLSFSNADYSKLVRRVIWSKAYIYGTGGKEKGKKTPPQAQVVICALLSFPFSVSHYFVMYGIPSNQSRGGGKWIA